MADSWDLIGDVEEDRVWVFATCISSSGYEEVRGAGPKC